MTLETARAWRSRFHGARALDTQRCHFSLELLANRIVRLVRRDECTDRVAARHLLEHRNKEADLDLRTLLEQAVQRSCAFRLTQDAEPCVSTTKTKNAHCSIALSSSLKFWSSEAAAISSAVSAGAQRLRTECSLVVLQVLEPLVNHLGCRVSHCGAQKNILSGVLCWPTGSISELGRRLRAPMPGTCAPRLRGVSCAG